MNQFRIVNVLTVLAGALLISSASIYNGYPFVYPDSGGYIAYENPIHRTPFYSIFLYALHWKTSLWPVVFAQCLMIAYLVWLTVRIFAGNPDSISFILVCAALTILTPLPWVAGYLLPDIFTPAVILMLYLLVVAPIRLTRLETAYCVCLLALAILFHLSHLLISYIICALFLVSAPFSSHPKRRLVRTAVVSLIPAVATAILVANTAMHFGKVSLSAGGYAFLLARMSATGQLEQCLDNRCSDKPYKLCAYRDSLPASSSDFLWSDSSPFKAVGGLYGYQAEGTQLARECILDDPGTFVVDAIKSGFRQLSFFQTGYSLVSLTHVSWLTSVFRQNYPQEFEAYMNSRQNRGELRLRRLANVHRWVVVFSLAVLTCYLVVKVLRGNFGRIGIIVFMLVAVAICGLVTGGLSVPDPRYMNRVIWLIPLCAALVLTWGWRKRADD